MPSLRQRAFEWACGPAALVARLCHSVIPRRQAVILCYHGVTGHGAAEASGIHYPDPHCPLNVFAEQMEFIARNFAVVTVGEIVGHIQEGRPFPRGSVAITFDDAYTSVYDTAWPILRKWQLRATVLVTAGLVDTDQLHWPDEVAECVAHHPGQELVLDIGGEWRKFDLSSGPGRAEAARAVIYSLKALPNEDRLGVLARLRGLLGGRTQGASAGVRTCSSAQIREMHDHGIEIGSHTMTHPVLTKIEDDGKLHAELLGSRERLEEVTGSPIRLLAYPDGAYDDRVLAAARSAGYDGAVTVDGTTVGLGSDPFAVGRLDPSQHPARFRAQVLGLEPRLRALCSWPRVGQNSLRYGGAATRAGDP